MQLLLDIGEVIVVKGVRCAVVTFGAGQFVLRPIEQTQIVNAASVRMLQQCEQRVTHVDSSRTSVIQTAR